MNPSYGHDSANLPLPWIIPGWQTPILADLALACLEPGISHL
ncbi:hypothetical protein GFS31_23740 [Leptolyngbya sp. BL0902]|nr:hypothetical protein GFS31_23740 [Leptolyngbya sp. BL0902]